MNVIGLKLPVTMHVLLCRSTYCSHCCVYSTCRVRFYTRLSSISRPLCHFMKGKGLSHLKQHGAACLVLFIALFILNRERIKKKKKKSTTLFRLRKSHNFHFKV